MPGIGKDEIKESYMDFNIPNKPKPYVMAHRGNLVACPENTQASFRRAIEDGTDLIETDVHVTADGHIVCIHDGTVDRTTDGSGAVRDMTLDEIKQLSASYGREAFATERVLTLAEFFAMLPQGMPAALELKTDDFLDPVHARRLLAEIVTAGRADTTVLLSFHDNRVRFAAGVARQDGVDLPTGFITYKRIVPKPGVELLGPVWPILFLNPLYVWLAHRRGQPVCPLDPTPDGRLWLYRLLGCDAVLTNDPGGTLRRLGRGE